MCACVARVRACVRVCVWCVNGKLCITLEQVKEMRERERGGGDIHPPSLQKKKMHQGGKRQAKITSDLLVKHERRKKKHCSEAGSPVKHFPIPTSVFHSNPKHNDLKKKKKLIFPNTFLLRFAQNSTDLPVTRRVPSLSAQVTMSLWPSRRRSVKRDATHWVRSARSVRRR